MAASKLKEVFSGLKKLSNTGVYLSLFSIIIFLNMASHTNAMQCSQTDYLSKKDYCSCKFENGSIFSLKLLLEEDYLLKQKGYLEANVTAPGAKYVYYYYQPCIGIDVVEHTELNLACKDMSSCQKNFDGKFYGNGLANSAIITGDPPNSNLVITYKAADNRITSVEVICNPSKKIGELEFLREDPAKHYYMKVRSAFACARQPPGLSGGSVLLIIFFVLVVIYFVGGMIFMRAVKGAQGKEVIPNNEFWSDLPYMIRDGFLFLANGCKADSTYDQI